MSNGKIKLINSQFQGQITSYTMNLKFWLEKNPKWTSEKSPQFVVMGKAPAGHAFQAGVAWEYTIKTGKQIGQSMFSLTLDDPAFGDQPLRFSAFPSAHDEWDLQSERKRQGVDAAPAKAADSGADDVPFPDTVAA